MCVPGCRAGLPLGGRGERHVAFRASVAPPRPAVVFLHIVTNLVDYCSASASLLVFCFLKITDFGRSSCCCWCVCASKWAQEFAGLNFSPGTSKAEQIRVCAINDCVPGCRSCTSRSGSGLLNLVGLDLDLEVRLYPLLSFNLKSARPNSPA